MADEAPEAPTPAIELPPDISTISVAEHLADSAYDRVALPGAQDKVSGRMLKLPAQRSGERLIVKLDPPEYPHVVRKEAAMLRLAGRAGLAVPDWHLAKDATGLDVLCITRFDRRPDGTILAAEDASQVLGLWPADKYRPSIEAAATALIDLCSARPVAARDLFAQILFAVISGNGDQHAKNLSVLANPDQSEWRISPAYDLPSTAPYGDTTSALTIDGGRRGVPAGRR